MKQQEIRDRLAKIATDHADRYAQLDALMKGKYPVKVETVTEAVVEASKTSFDELVALLVEIAQ